MTNNTGIQNLLTELFQLYVSLPISKEKKELNKIISMIRNNSDLKGILLTIQGHIDIESSVNSTNKTFNQKNINFWKHILSIFTKYLRR